MSHNIEIDRLEDFTVLGVNHWKTPLEVRERFSLSETLIKRIYHQSLDADIKDFFIVSTCNRTEIYSYTEVHRQVKYCFVTHSEGNPNSFDEYVFEKKGKNAIKHLMSVATGIDSQVLGDIQILNQVKKSYEQASELGLISGKFHRLMQHVFRAHKRSRNETSLGDGAATIAHAAVRTASEHFGDITDKKILIVGTGEMGKITCKNLVNIGNRNIFLSNRTKERADMLSDINHLETIDFKQIHKRLGEFDVVVCATASDKPVIKANLVEKDFSKDSDTLMIDLCVPHNIDTAFADFDNVKLVNMDTLSTVADEAYQKRKESVPEVQRIIDKEIFDYYIWLEEQNIVPTIKAINNKFDEIREQEFDFFKNKIKDTDVEKVEQLTKRIVSKIAAYSIEHLRNNKSNEDISIELLKDIYKLDSEN